MLPRQRRQRSGPSIDPDERPRLRNLGPHERETIELTTHRDRGRHLTVFLAAVRDLRAKSGRVIGIADEPHEQPVHVPAR